MTPKEKLSNTPMGKLAPYLNENLTLQGVQNVIKCMQEYSNQQNKELIEALKSITYTDHNNVTRIALHGDSEVPEIVYQALNNTI